MRDLISRQAAIAALGTITMYKGMIPFDTAMERIKRMPPAELGTNLAEVGTDCISREQAIDTMEEYFARIGKLKRRGLNKGEKAIALDTVGAIKSLPSAQPKMGRWIHHPEIGWGETWLCDQCGEKTTSTVMGKPRANFCPNCGAEMEA